MFSRKERQNIIIFILGVFVGIALSAIVAYFSVIAGFTKDNIIKITNILPSYSDSVQVVTTKIESQEKKRTMLKDTLLKVDSVERQEDSLSQKEAVKSDTKIAEEIIPIICMEDSTENAVVAIKKEMRVEQWDSPMNFSGYKLSPNLLIIYGIELKNIELQYIDEFICLIVGEKRLILKETDNFVRFPLGFFK